MKKNKTQFYSLPVEETHKLNNKITESGTQIIRQFRIHVLRKLIFFWRKYISQKIKRSVKKTRSKCNFYPYRNTFIAYLHLQPKNTTFTCRKRRG